MQQKDITERASVNIPSLSYLTRQHKFIQEKGKEFFHSCSQDMLKGNQESLIHYLEKANDQIIDQESTAMEDGLIFLASVSSSAPFIGLLGTVVGIINSFQKIGISGDTSLATVAPGISEALIATALGLFAAIPALLAYNFFRNKIRFLRNDMRIKGNALINQEYQSLIKGI